MSYTIAAQFDNHFNRINNKKTKRGYMMLPKKELQDLANALRSTPEFSEMISQRRLIMRNPRLSRAMMTFEREHARIMHHDFPEEQVASHLKNLFAENKVFLETAEVKAYMKATQEYHQMVTQCVDYLNGLLDVSQTMKPY
jgi:cell fate (sporulation/competence/biofilm development) regulator YlbF (YheA/YmcA/DUF963 family)